MGTSTFVSGEGSAAGVTSVGLSSGLGTAAAVTVGSDIMLWEWLNNGSTAQRERRTRTGIKNKEGRERQIEERIKKKPLGLEGRGRSKWTDEREEW